MKLKKILIILVFIPFIFSLASCWDLGNYEDAVSYVNSFEVYMVDDTGIDDSFSMSDFYNQDTVDYKMPEGFEAKKYKYLALKVTAEHLNVGNIVMSLSSTTDSSINVEMSVVSKIPSKPRNLDSDLQKLKDYIEKKKTDPNAVLTLDESDDPKYLAKTSLTVKANKFDEIVIVSYKNHGDTVEVNKDEYILFEFLNNTDSGVEIKDSMTEEEATDLIKQRRKNQINIAFMNFLIESK